MPKRLKPEPLLPELDEDPIWGNLFGSIGRPLPDRKPDIPSSAPPLKRQQVKTVRKRSNKGALPDRAGDP